jgi:cupin fold WbuC family metalloprotein
MNELLGGRFHQDAEALSPSFYATSSSASVDVALVEQLCEIASSGEEAVRICLHTSPAQSLHSMIIAKPKSTYSQPRMHPTKDKVFVPVSGSLAVVLFSLSGDVLGVHLLSSIDSVAVYVPSGVFHTDFAVSPVAAYHEAITGPYDPQSDDRVYAAFAPDQADQDAGKRFNDQLLKLVHNGV